MLKAVRSVVSLPPKIITVEIRTRLRESANPTRTFLKLDVFSPSSKIAITLPNLQGDGSDATEGTESDAGEGAGLQVHGGLIVPKTKHAEHRP